MYSDDVLEILWLRGFDNIKESYGTKARVYSSVGIPGSGKSALLESIATKSPKILDLYGSRDNEGLAWLRSPFGKSALLLTGNAVDVTCNCADVMKVSEVKLKDFERYKVIISCASFYTNMDREYYSLGRLIRMFWRRTHWDEPWFLILREAGNLLYSRMSLGDTQQLTKTQFIYVIRELRHSGISIGLDTLRWFAIDINIRHLSHYTFFKAQGVEGLPKDLNFLYRDVHPAGIRNMAVNKFLILTARGMYGTGRSKCPEWHKREREDLLTQFDIRCKYKVLPYEGDQAGMRVNDYEHVRIVKTKFEKKIGMEKLGQTLGRSSKTIHKHIHHHNNMVHALGECDKCARVGSKLAKQAID